MDTGGQTDSIRELLRCSACQGELKEKDGGLRCACGAQYPIADGVPVMRPGVVDAASYSPSPDSIYNKICLNRESAIGKLYDFFGSGYIPYPFDYAAHIDRDGLILNLGSGMMPPTLPRMVNVDFFKYPHVKIVVDGQYLPFADNMFDAVVSESVIEHIPDPYKALAEMVRVLKPGGKLYISYPFLVLQHDVPGDYTRFTIDGMKTRLCGRGEMRELNAGVLTGAACLLTSTIANFFCAFFKPGKLRFVVRAGVLFCLFPIRYLDLFLNKKNDAPITGVILYGLFEKTLFVRSPGGRSLHTLS